MILIASIIMLACSFATVEVNMAALKFNTIQKQYDETKVFQPGRYFVGLGNSFVEFPLTWQKLSFCQGCEDGPAVSGKAAKRGTNPVSVYLSIHMFYKIRIEYLAQIIKMFPRKDWHPRYVSLVKNAIVEYLAKELEVDDLLENRGKVARQFSLVVNDRIQPVFAYLQALYIGHVQLEKTSDEAYLRQWIAERSKMTSEKEGLAKEIQAETKGDVTKIETETATILSTQYKLGNATVAKAMAEGEELVIAARGNGYQTIKANLSFTHEELLRYVYYDKVRRDASSVVAGFNLNNKLMSSVSR
jgi:hypothetical protein